MLCVRRDALQILRLIRRYNLEKKQQTREHQIVEDENKRQYAQELKELEVQTARKLEVLKRELDQRRKALSDELTAEIIAEITAAKYKKDEAERQAQIAKDERKIRWDEQVADEMIRMDDRINDLADKYAKEEGLTKAHVDAIIKEFERAFGSGGAVEKLYQRFMQMVANGMAVAGWMDAGLGSYVPPTSFGSGENTGGTVPSLTPTPSPPSGGGGGTIPNMPVQSSVGAPGTSGQLAIELFLSPDLQAKIINNTLNQVANVLVEVQRKVL